MKRTIALIPVLLFLLTTSTLPFSAFGQQAPSATTAIQTAQQVPAESPLLTVDSIFTYRSRSLGPVQWQQDGSSYLALEPFANQKEFLDIVRYDAVSGERTIKVPVETLTPAGASSPILVEEFTLSSDEQKLLIFTNSERVWRSNTRGDYWVVDLKSGELLERRWLCNSERDVSLSGRVSGGYGCRSHGRPSLLRHDLPGTLLRSASRPP